MLAQAIQRCQEAGEVVLSGATAFQLYDTFGFPLELTAELGRFRIIKEEAVGTGIRRLKAILEP